MSNEENIQEPDERSGFITARVAEGYYLIEHEQHPRMRVKIEAPCQPLYERGYYYGSTPRPERKWDPEKDEVQMPNISPELGHRYQIDGDYARAMSEMLAVAADLYDALLIWFEPRLAEQAHLKQAIIDRQQREEEEKARARNELKDLLQNYIGSTFKLKRDGYRATVFGTVDRIDDRRLWTTSERGVKMTTIIADINFFAVKWDGERRYETVYDRKAVTS